MSKSDMIKYCPSFNDNCFKEGFAYRIHVCATFGGVLSEISSISLCDMNTDLDDRMWFQEGLRNGMSCLFKCFQNNGTEAVFITIDLHSLIYIKIKADWVSTGDVVVKAMKEVE